MSTTTEARRLEVGDVILIHTPAPSGGGERAFVYETYTDFDDKQKRGVSLITESGRETGGWSFEEQAKWITFLKHSDVEYEFKNVVQVDRDFRDGIFKPAFV